MQRPDKLFPLDTHGMANNTPACLYAHGMARNTPGCLARVQVAGSGNAMQFFDLVGEVIFA